MRSHHSHLPLSGYYFFICSLVIQAYLLCLLTFFAHFFWVSFIQKTIFSKNSRSNISYSTFTSRTLSFFYQDVESISPSRKDFVTTSMNRIWWKSLHNFWSWDIKSKYNLSLSISLCLSLPLLTSLPLSFSPSLPPSLQLRFQLLATMSCDTCEGVKL